MSEKIRDYSVTETLAESGSMLVCRADRLANGESVLLKILKPDGGTKEERARFKREFEITSRRDLPGVAKALALEEYDEGLAIVFEDIGGQFMQSMLEQGPLSLTDSLEVAIALADTVGVLHKQHIIHKGIKPYHVFVNPATRQVNLMGFEFADETPERSVTALPPSALERTLAYISPEQTGRMNRPVDYRTDFYSLGVTLYQMLTGTLPFKGDDALEIVYSHIARTPVPPHERNGTIPKVVSRIVMKLMSKMADDRYQSAWGLKADLEKCVRGLIEEGLVRSFELGLDDVSDQLRFPEKLYGREGELDQLLHAFARVSDGERELLLVTGYAGVGKTRLVRELHKSAIEKQGYIVEGKFDQLQQNVPYFAWIQAFTELVNYVLMGSKAELKRWKQDIQQAVGGIGGVLTDVIPNLELIIGPQPPVPELGGAEAQNRFNYVFLEFVKAIATKDRPLVVFLDDLQWIDAASLKLLEAVMTAGGVSSILLIGAYRDNEVNAFHPLMKSIDALRKDSTRTGMVTLQDLSEKTVNELIAVTLHRERSETAPLTHLIYSKTGGNPFFLLETIKALAEKQAILFDIASRAWQWDASTIEKMGITDNVVTLMVDKIRLLASETQHLLPLAASMGFTFSLRNLSIIARQSEDDVLQGLQHALREGLLIAGAEQYQFVHDRVQQAAYTLIPVDERPAQHLQIGRLLLENTPEEKLTGNVFTIIDHLNRGMSLITEPKAKQRLAELNLMAGRQARTSTAFTLAANYFAVGTAALGPDAWEESYELAFSLHTGLAECEYLVGSFAHAEKLLDEALDHARSLLDRALVYRMYQRLYQQSGRWSEAVSAALKGLELLGVSFPETDEEIRLATEAEKRQIQVNLHGRRIADLADVPFTDDAETQVLIGLLAEAITQFFITRPVLWHLIVLKCVNLCLERGHVQESPYVYSSYCKMLVALYNDIPSAFEFSQMSLKLNERLSSGGFMKGLPPFFHASVVGFWCQHFETNLPLLDQAFQAFLDSGDIIWASYLTYNAVWLHLENGDPLQQVIELARRYAAFNQGSHNDVVYNVDRVEEQFALGLQGTTRSLTDFNDGAFDEADSIAAIERAGFGIGIAYYRIMKQIAAFVAGQFDEALEWADRVVPVLASVSSMAIWGSYHFYYALTMAALYDQISEKKQDKFMQILKGILEKLQFWADNCSENFGNRAALLEAEIARIERRDQDAMHLYEKAIASARENRFIQNEAIAYDIAGRFYRQRGFERIARTYLTQARACYSRWGALGKVKEMERLHPWLPSSSTPLTERLDAVSLAKAQQAISSEIEMDKLLGSVMHIVMENTGAQSGFLLLEQDGEWRIAAKGGIDAAEVKMPQPAGIEESAMVSPGVVLFVARTKEAIVLDDAASRGEFVNDPHIRGERTKSLLCVPLLSRGRLMGILYLENNLTTQAFNPERVQLLEMLLSQAAISLENARMYEALRESEERHRFILRTAMDGFFRTDMQGRILEVNEAYCRMTGYSGQELLTMAIADVEAVHTAEMITANIRRFEEVGPDRFESVHRRKDGTLFHVEISAQYQPIAGGQIVIFVRDITERKRAEETRLILAAIVESSDDAILSKDLDGTITSWNQGAERLYGYAAAEALGRPVSVLMPADQQDQMAELLKRIKEGGRIKHYETKRVTKDGQTIDVSLTLSPIRDHRGRIIGASTIARDITPQKRAEEALRLAGIYNRSLIEASLDPLVTIDPEGRITDVNAATEQATGYTRSQLIGTDFCDYFTEPEKAKSGYRQVFSEGLVRDYELNIRHRDGKITPVLYNASVYRDEAGKVIGVFAAARDITERKQAQEALQKLLADLELRVKERTKELSEANQSLQAANKELESFSYSVSHDLRAPLRAIDGFSMMVLKGYADKLDDEGRRKLNVIRSNAQRMDNLINDLLAFSRLGRKEMGSASVDMEALVWSTWRELAVVNPERRIQFSVQKLPHAMGDQTLIKEVVVNLLTNAIKFSKSRERAVVEVDAYPEGERNVYVVRDNGVGFDMQYYDKLFGVFQRLHSTDEFEGTGVGLAIVERIIHRHGGRVWAQGKVGEGATFYFTLAKKE